MRSAEEAEDEPPPAPTPSPMTAAQSVHRVQDDHGRLLRDNVYGTIDEDVWRRDFTVNALYYNIADFSIWDYVDGLADIRARRLRLIGDAETRYREDPVRMLRAARFEAKLGFEIDPVSAAPMAHLQQLLGSVPPARLFDETAKLFLTGHGAESLRVLRKHQLLAVLFPAVERYLERHPGSLVEQLLIQGLQNTDRRVAEDKAVTPTFLYALLLYGPIAAHIESLPPKRWHEPQAILEACERALREAQQRISIPRRTALGVREMYALQPRLEGPRGRRALRLLEQPRFRAAYDLLALRATLGLANAGDGTVVDGLAGRARRRSASSIVDAASRSGHSHSGGGDAPRPPGRKWTPAAAPGGAVGAAAGDVAVAQRRRRWRWRRWRWRRRGLTASSPCMASLPMWASAATCAIRLRRCAQRSPRWARSRRHAVHAAILALSIEPDGPGRAAGLLQRRGRPAHGTRCARAVR